MLEEPRGPEAGIAEEEFGTSGRGRRMALPTFTANRYSAATETGARPRISMKCQLRIGDAGTVDMLHLGGADARPVGAAAAMRSRRRMSKRFCLSASESAAGPAAGSVGRTSPPSGTNLLKAVVVESAFAGCWPTRNAGIPAPRAHILAEERPKPARRVQRRPARGGIPRDRRRCRRATAPRS